MQFIDHNVCLRFSKIMCTRGAYDCSPTVQLLRNISLVPKLNRPKIKWQIFFFFILHWAGVNLQRNLLGKNTNMYYKVSELLFTYIWFNIFLNPKAQILALKMKVVLSIFPEVILVLFTLTEDSSDVYCTYLLLIQF